MNRASRLGILFLAITAAFAPSRSLVAAIEGDRPAAAPSSGARARQLAADVHEFATAPGLSRAKREKRIAGAVRTAVVAATAYQRNANEALGAASELAAAAAHAAPAYTEVIVKAASLAPGVAHVDGASGAIRSAALAGAQGKASRTAHAAAYSAGTEPPVHTTSARKKTTAKTAPPPESEAAMTDEPVEAPAESAQMTQPPENEVGLQNYGRHPVEDSAFVLSGTLNGVARRDDNVFLTPTNEISDTILSVVPGVGMRWGDKSRTHGSLSYSESFDHYVDKTSPDVSLGNGAFDFAFDTGVTSGAANATYAQLYQTNLDLAAAGITQRIQTDLSSASAHVEGNPWAKIGGRLGVTYAKTAYKSGGLIGNTQVGVPFSLIFNATPKTDFTVGYTYSTQSPDGGGESSKDHYFNVGARGLFTAKLSGSLDVGYQTRQVGDHPSDHIMAFNGAFDYELTPRTRMALNANRSFNASSLGATTTNTVFSLRLTADLSPQFQMGATVGYSINEYGEGVFRPDQITPQVRTDHLWEGSITASYLFTEWFSTSAAYNLRSNNSTVDSVEFSNNVLSLTLGLKY